MTSLVALKANTQRDIKNIVKPLSAYQYYTKAILEKWRDLPEEEKKRFDEQAKQDKERYESEKKKIQEKSEEEVQQLNIFLIRSYGKVPCVGLDNGFTSYQVTGPIKQVELFTEKEKKRLVERGIAAKYIGDYKSIGPLKFNWRAAKKYGVTVYGGCTNDSDTWWGVRENYEGKAGQFTSYNNYKDETWTENY